MPIRSAVGGAHRAAERGAGSGTGGAELLPAGAGQGEHVLGDHEATVRGEEG